MDKLIVAAVVKESIAEELGIHRGDRVVSVNDHPVRDIIDFHYYGGDDESFTLGILSDTEGEWYAEVEKFEGEQLGILFDPPVPRNCGNNCLFCFVHQLPEGLRKPLYVKDEDFRLSFLYGNFVTLANLSEKDFKRIADQRLSPLYISVHAADSDVRNRLLGKREKIPVMQSLKRLSQCGINFHAQIVLCPNLNDGKILEDTLIQLLGVYPNLKSIAVVPVGLTSQRRGLPDLAPVTREYALATVKHLSELQKMIKKQVGEHLLFMADEWFIKAQVEFPPLKDYADLPQLENGVGMIPLFVNEAKKVLKKAKVLGDVDFTVVTGESAFPFISSFASNLSAVTGVTISVVSVENRLFGKSVSVTGLISGKDILTALKDISKDSILVIPDVMIKEGEGIFLDDMTLEDLSLMANMRVVVAKSTPQGLYETLKSAQNGRKRRV